MLSSREQNPNGQGPSRADLARAGFINTTRAQRLLADPALTPLLEATPVGLLLADLADSPDPDQATLALVRLCEASPKPQQLAQDLKRSSHRRRLLALLGASSALGDFLIANPDSVACLDQEFDAEKVAATMTSRVKSALDAGSIPDAVHGLRLGYYQALCTIAAGDLTHPQPLQYMPQVGLQLSQLADAAVAAALPIAYRKAGASDQLAFCVIAMGKTGARELNYISDVDVMYVVGGALDETQATAIGSAVASALTDIISGVGTLAPLWPLDAALRPEGKDGVLVRSIDSYRSYYTKWAQSWEFQALLKARPMAGDMNLGQQFIDLTAPLVWQASARENFVSDAQAMRRRVEKESAKTRDDRRIKLGPGGLRDVEFTVQLLQLVHGRSDTHLRSAATLEALNELIDGGYIGRSAGQAMSRCYRFERLIEHRAQLSRLRRTHDLPKKEANLRRIARSIGTDLEGKNLTNATELEKAFNRTRRQVRTLHEEIFYRPLLSATASLSEAEMRLSPQAARERLAAFGYRDPDGAMRQIEALTEGLSRRAAILRQLLPVMIGWMGMGADPDQGLLSFRRLSDAIGSSHWFMGMLRDSRLVAKRLSYICSGSRWTSDRLSETPQAVSWLDDDADLQIRPREVLAGEVASLLRRRLLGMRSENYEQVATEAISTLLAIRSREQLRSAMADTLDGVDPLRGAAALSQVTEVVLDGAIRVAHAVAIAQTQGPQALEKGVDETGHLLAAHAEHAIIAMGRLGGAELSYASDTDVLFVHRPRPGATTTQAQTEADQLARWLISALKTDAMHALVLDADLRPEGRNGALSRSLDAYREYYERWGQVWERQALIRARYVAGSHTVGQLFTELIAPLRYSTKGLNTDELRQVRHLKARMETERLPRGTNPRRHLKLGPGGLSDVEWAVQLLQLRHAHTHPELQTTSTLQALQAANQAQLINQTDTQTLRQAWLAASRLRSANVLATGRTSGYRLELLPNTAIDLRMVARLLYYPAGQDAQVEEDYLRAARHARTVVEKLLFAA